ncbi:MAG: hypothetical protein ABJA83_12640 [Burkholderiaceae bacterium]
MNSYNPGTPRIAFMIAAAALTAVTIGLFVIVPAKMDSITPDATVLTVEKGTVAEPAVVLIIPSHVEVIGERERTVALAEEPAVDAKIVRQVPFAARAITQRDGSR